MTFVERNNILATINIISWLRGLSYLRLFKKTRIFINLLLEILKDMIAFLIVLILSLLGFAISFRAIDMEDHHDIGKYLA